MKYRYSTFSNYKRCFLIPLNIHKCRVLFSCGHARTIELSKMLNATNSEFSHRNVLRTKVNMSFLLFSITLRARHSNNNKKHTHTHKELENTFDHTCCCCCCYLIRFYSSSWKIDFQLAFNDKRIDMANKEIHSVTSVVCWFAICSMIQCVSDTLYCNYMPWGNGLKL